MYCAFSGSLTYMEEVQMEKDITNYDLRFCKLNFTVSSDDCNMMITEFVVKGGNENRPKISVGDIVRYLKLI
jgi:hypothetical protein